MFRMGFQFRENTFDLQLTLKKGYFLPKMGIDVVELASLLVCKQFYKFKQPIKTSLGLFPNQ